MIMLDESIDKVTFRFSILVVFILGLYSCFGSAFSVQAQEQSTVQLEKTETGGAIGNVQKGEALFKSLCAACHKRYKKMTGPALFGVADKYDREWLYAWIKNSAALIASGDAQANAIYEEYNKTAMNAFPQLSNPDIDNILAYVMEPKATPKSGEVSAIAVSDSGSDDGGFTVNIVLGILIVVLLLLVVVLVLVNKTLRSFADRNGLVYPDPRFEKRTPLWKVFIENQFLVLCTAIFLLLLSGYYAYAYFMQIGIDQGYAPVQPIHYSHRIHAGENKIDCKYCHASARVSKHSGIPSLNVCMNCHKSISEVAETTATEDYSKAFYDGEIQKLYKAVGWDEESQSYTGDTEAVKWVRIHNLPDFAYFNHSQHVSVAGVACQTCHGPVEEMEIMYQHAPLTMGWCINCHRETNIKVADNAYYEKIHQELSKKYGVSKLTAAQMGGLECGKCHY